MGTVIDNLQVSQSGHHGIDVRGRKVNLRNVIVSNVYDGDSLRLDAGYQGNIQYALVGSMMRSATGLNHGYARSVGRWVLAPEPYSWGVGPDEFNKDWWSADESILESAVAVFAMMNIYSARTVPSGRTIMGIHTGKCGRALITMNAVTLCRLMMARHWELGVMTTRQAVANP